MQTVRMVGPRATSSGPIYRSVVRETTIPMQTISARRIVAPPGTVAGPTLIRRAAPTLIRAR